MRKILFGVGFAAVLALGYLLWPEEVLRHSPGVLVQEEPLQTPVAAVRHWQRGDYEITSLAEFTLRGLVLGKERYRSGRESDLSPVDLALGWGPMSDQQIVDAFDISQGGRWYRWKSAKPPIPAGTVITHSANMHMIPATPEIEQDLVSIRRGEVVALKGYLVEVRGNDGWKWRSSLRRDDTGGGSCELVWVEQVSVLQ